jgi:hypothetical protein
MSNNSNTPNVQKFRKKPVVIEAMQWHIDVNTKEIEKFVGQNLEFKYDPETPGKYFLMIPTLESPHEAAADDWIIKGVNGEFYPCKPDIFKKTYEPVITERSANRGLWFKIVNEIGDNWEQDPENENANDEVIQKLEAILSSRYQPVQTLVRNSLFGWQAGFSIGCQTFWLQSNLDSIPEENTEEYARWMEGNLKDAFAKISSTPAQVTQQLDKSVDEIESELVEEILQKFNDIGIDTSDWEHKFGDGHFAAEFIQAGIKDYLENLVTGGKSAHDKIIPDIQKLKAESK